MSIFIGANGDDTLLPLGGDNSGTDTIYVSVTYTLPQFVERLILTGSGNISATGGDAADTLE